MGRFDRYVGRTVLASYGAALAFMIFLVILFELLLNIGDYLHLAEKRGTGTMEMLGYLARYFVLMTPLLYVIVAPFVTVIACMFAISRMMTLNELAPMLFTGRSMWRVLVPTLLVALGSGVAMAACWEFAIPAVIDRVQESRVVLQGKDAAYERLVVRSLSRPGVELYCASYSHADESMTGVILYDPGSAEGDAEQVLADEAWWDPEREVWRLVNGRVVRGHHSAPLRSLGVPDLAPDRLWQAAKDSKQTGELSYTDLIDLRRLKPNRTDYVLQFHRHFTGPLANIVLLLLALPFAIHFERGSKLERVLYAIAICGAYLVVDLSCQNLGMRGTVDPVVAAWAPTILFGSLGLVLFGGVRT